MQRAYHSADPLQPFHRLFVYSPVKTGEPWWEVHVRPDPEQPGAATEPVTILRRETEQLASCLDTLGVDGWSRFAYEGETGTVFQYLPCSTQEAVALLKANPLSPRHQSITLIASRSSISDMRERLAVAQRRQEK